MKTIAVTQKILEKGEPTLRCGSFASPGNWVASFLDFQIGKLGEHFVEIRAGMDAPSSEITGDPIWN